MRRYSTRYPPAAAPTPAAAQSAAATLAPPAAAAAAVAAAFPHLHLLQGARRRAIPAPNSDPDPNIYPSSDPNPIPNPDPSPNPNPNSSPNPNPNRTPTHDQWPFDPYHVLCLPRMAGHQPQP